MPDYEANGEDIDNYGSSPIPKSRSSHGGYNPDDYTDSKPQVLKYSLSLSDHPLSPISFFESSYGWDLGNINWRFQDPLKRCLNPLQTLSSALVFLHNLAPKLREGGAWSISGTPKSSHLFLEQQNEGIFAQYMCLWAVASFMLGWWRQAGLGQVSHTSAGGW